MVMFNIFTCLFLFTCCKSCLGYFITVDAYGKECFFEKAFVNNKLGLTFEVTEGGFLDIDVEVSGPDKRNIYRGTKESNGKYTFVAQLDGTYKFCFSNAMSTVTPKVLKFNIEGGQVNKTEENNAETQNKLEKMVRELSVAMYGVKREQEYMEIRERIHRGINDSTNFRVVLWAFFESAVLVLMSLGQIYYLKRFFEVRRVI